MGRRRGWRGEVAGLERGQAAAAIMAALSVERASVGKDTRRRRRGFGGEAGAEFAVGGDASGDEGCGGAEGFGGGEGLLHQVADDGVLEAGDEVEGLRVAGGERVFDGGAARGVGAGEERFAAGLGFGAQVVEFDVAEDGGLDS
jgi:hypothetical protein